uniref:Uncharacterized protein n=1 Tax=Octopus bimaculoides TaxID=37653 RepID=A0A0L8G2M7_OCTBM
MLYIFRDNGVYQAQPIIETEINSEIRMYSIPNISSNIHLTVQCVRPYCSIYVFTLGRVYVYV